jgi:hypothetical protein
MAANMNELQSTALRQIAIDAPRYSGYKPLDPAKREIRLLDIKPGLDCQLRTVSLDDNPEYAALSYYWGPPGINREITINGETVPIRKTLYHFLKALCKVKGPQTVWLDVICINQRLVSEQSAQVAMMGEIYTRAAFVFSWLGEPDCDMEYAMAWLNTDKHDKDFFYDQEAERTGLEQIFRRRYWKRTWILQECLVNRNTLVLCGTNLVKLVELVSKLQMRENPELKASWPMRPVRRQGFAGPNGHMWSWPELFERAREGFTSAEGLSVLCLVHEFSASECYNPKDKFYGMRALARDGPLLQVDYRYCIFDIFVQSVSLHNWSSFRSWVAGLSIDVEGSSSAGSTNQEWWQRLPTGVPSFNGGLLDDSASVCDQLDFISYEEILRGLVDSDRDWLVIPAHSADDFSSDDENLALTLLQVDPATSKLYRLGAAPSLIDVNIVDGRINDVRIWRACRFDAFSKPTLADVERLRGPETRSELDSLLRDHIWSCHETEAFHISRTMFAMLIKWPFTSLRDDAERALSFIQSAGTSRPNGRCVCKMSVGFKSPHPSSWSRPTRIADEQG